MLEYSEKTKNRNNIEKMSLDSKAEVLKLEREIAALEKEGVGASEGVIAEIAPPQETAGAGTEEAGGAKKTAAPKKRKRLPEAGKETPAKAARAEGALEGGKPLEDAKMNKKKCMKKKKGPGALQKLLCHFLKAQSPGGPAGTLEGTTAPPKTETRDLSEAFQKLGMGSLGAKLYPCPRQIAFVEKLMGGARKSAGVECAFVFLDIKNRIFLSEEAIEKAGLKKGPAVQNENSQVQKLSEEIIKLRGEGEEKAYSPTAVGLINFLFSHLILCQATGCADKHGGPGSFLAYIISLFSQAVSERVSAIVTVDGYMRAHFARLSAANERFDIAECAEKQFPFFRQQSARSE